MIPGSAFTVQRTGKKNECIVFVNVYYRRKGNYILSIIFTEQDIVSRKVAAVKSHYIEFPKSWVKLFEGKDIVVMPGGNKGILNIYFLSEWEKVIEKLRQDISGKGKSGEIILRSYLAASVQEQLENGRLYLPENMLYRAGIEEKAELMEIRKDGANFFALRKAP